MGRSAFPDEKPRDCVAGATAGRRRPLGQRAGVEPGGAGLPSGGLGAGRRFLARPAARPATDAGPRRRRASPAPACRWCVVVEKILGPEEPLPEHWPVAGTTGYDFLNHVNGLFVDAAGLSELGKVYSRFLDQKLDFREVAYQSKLLILRATMASEVHLLAHRLNRISRRHRRSRDFTLNALRGALREILACFPVYRTYIHEGHVSERDRQFVCRAVAQAKRRNPTLDAAVFDFIRDVLLLQLPPPLDEADRRERELFVGRFQQATSPVMAKGIEDTAFYRYCPLLSLNEVGGDPARGPTTLEEFHRQNLARQARWPRSLLATSTHDVKRSEDTRARINVLSEIPHRWRTALNRWARLNRRHRREVDGLPAPSRNDEYLFYQSLVGVWPLAAAGDRVAGPTHRPHAGLHGEGHPRGQDRTPTGSTPTRATTRRSASSSPPCWPRGRRTASSANSAASTSRWSTGDFTARSPRCS